MEKLKVGDIITLEQCQAIYGDTFNQYRIYHDITKDRYYIKVNFVNGRPITRLAKAGAHIVAYQKTEAGYRLPDQDVKPVIDSGIAVFFEGILPSIGDAIEIKDVKAKAATAVVKQQKPALYVLFSGDVPVSIGRFYALPSAVDFVNFDSAKYANSILTVKCVNIVEDQNASTKAGESTTIGTTNK